MSQPVRRDADAPRYRVYGITLASDFQFANRLVPARGEPDVTFTVTTREPGSGGLEAATPVFEDPAARNFATPNALYRLDEGYALRFAGIADFYIGRRHITCHLRDAAYSDVVEIYLLGTVLAFWLEWQGRVALHASAVVAGEHTMAFLSTHGGGKTSLAAALMAQGGALLTDDLLPVDRRDGRCLAHAGYPQMRFWPEGAAHFMGRYADFEIVTPGYDKRRVPVGPGGLGRFVSEAHELTCVYLPERRDPADGAHAVVFEAVSPGDAVIELIRGSFAPRNPEIAGLQPARLGALADLARSVPMRRLVYPNGLHELPRVAAAVLKDLDGLARP